MSTPAQCSQKLIQCLINLEVTATKSEAKMELMTIAGQLMPGGKPQFLEVVKYPMIKQLVETEGKKKILAILGLMIKDFCSSFNVVRNMNEDQMIEAAFMLLDECDNFRLEDYLLMFSMAKKGDLVKIMDRVDIQIITSILDEYWIRRKNAAKKHSEDEMNRLDSIGSTARQLDNLHPEDAKLLSAANGISAAMESLRSTFTEPVKSLEEAKKDIHKPKVTYQYGERQDGSTGIIKNDSE